MYRCMEHLIVVHWLLPTRPFIESLQFEATLGLQEQLTKYARTTIQEHCEQLVTYVSVVGPRLKLNL